MPAICESHKSTLPSCAEFAAPTAEDDQVQVLESAFLEHLWGGGDL